MSDSIEERFEAWWKTRWTGETKPGLIMIELAFKEVAKDAFYAGVSSVYD